MQTLSQLDGLASNLPHWASEGSEGVRSSKVLDRGVKRWLTRLNAACREAFLSEVSCGKRSTGCSAWSYTVR
ncbi:hypothetical protein EMIT0P294_10810 [Pseudomonas sp. IT-P294]